MRRPRGGWPAPDFLPRAVRPPWLAWVLLLTGAGVLALALADAATQAQRLDEARQRLTRWQKQAQPPIARVVAAAPDAAGVRAAGEVVRALAHPWRDVLLGAEAAAAPGVQWLRLDHDAERGEVRLDGSAPAADAVLRSLDALSHARGWHDVTLTRIDGGVAAGEPLRFEVRARQAAVGPQGLR